jgi:D-glycero-alpha-D-manno-heptose-7-phosphate kinase
MVAAPPGTRKGCRRFRAPTAREQRFVQPADPPGINAAAFSHIANDAGAAATPRARHVRAEGCRRADQAGNHVSCAIRRRAGGTFPWYPAYRHVPAAFANDYTFALPATAKTPPAATSRPPRVPAPDRACSRHAMASADQGGQPTRIIMLYRSRAPLRLGLAGGGTDLSPYCDSFGGAVLNATIDLYACATLEIGRRESTDVVFDAVDMGRRVALPHAQLMATDDATLPLHFAAYRRIVRDFCDGRTFPCRLVTYCEAPPGSGLGSSSTMVVAIVKAFVEALSLPLGEYDIAHLAFEIERLDAGLLGGRQDQYAAAFGGVNFIEFFADDRVVVNPLRVKNWILAELESSTVLFYTGVSRASADIIAEQTSNLSRESDRAIEAMHKLKNDAFLMKEAVLKGNIDRIAEILNSSWISKRQTAAQVSNARIDDIMRRAFEAGARAGKVSGAGGGGFITFIVDPVRRTELISTLEQIEGRVLTCSFTKNGTEGWRLD